MIESIILLLRKITIITLYIAIVSFVLWFFGATEYIKIIFYHLIVWLYIFFWFFLSDFTLKLLIVSILVDISIIVFLTIKKFI